MTHALADPLFRTDFPVPRQGEAATRRHAETLASRLGDIMRREAVTQDLLRFLRDYPNRRGGFALPAEARTDAYLVTAGGGQLV